MVPDRPRVLHQEPTGQVRLLEFTNRFDTVMGRYFGSRYTEYRRSWERSSQFSELPEFPLSLDLEVNASCNLKCIMCVMGSPDFKNPLADSPIMDRRLYERLMAQASEFNLPAMTFGYLSEPLLHPDLPEMIRLARKAGVMDIRLGTNAMLLTPETGQRLIDSGLTRLEVSLDAVEPDTYRRIRRGGRLETVTQNVLDFLENRDKKSSDFPLLRLSFLRLPHNEGELDRFLDCWRDKADLFSVQDPIYFEDAPIFKEIHLDHFEIANDFQCAQPWQRMIVRADGNAFPCCSLYGLEMKLGSAATKSIKDLWHKPTLARLRELHKKGQFSIHPVCRRCAERSAIKPGLPEPEGDHRGE